MTHLLLAATSGIGRAVANELAAAGNNLILAGRNKDDVESLASDLAIRHQIQTTPLVFDALDFDAQQSALDAAIRDLAAGDQLLAGAVLFTGYLGDHEAAIGGDQHEVVRILETNFTASALALERVARHLEAQGSGVICAVSSVAGDRGRQSNYLYGSAKAGLTAYLAGLRNRLFPSGVHVVTVKPGFVDTPMTYGKEGMFLVAKPEKVAKIIVKAMRRRRNTVYAPGFWRPILWIIRLVPEPIFKRLKL